MLSPPALPTGARTIAHPREGVNAGRSSVPRPVSPLLSLSHRHLEPHEMSEDGKTREDREDLVEGCHLRRQAQPIERARRHAGRGSIDRRLDDGADRTPTDAPPGSCGQTIYGNRGESVIEMGRGRKAVIGAGCDGASPLWPARQRGRPDGSPGRRSGRAAPERVAAPAGRCIERLIRDCQVAVRRVGIDPPGSSRRREAKGAARGGASVRRSVRECGP